jgi:hypothetical protein
LWLARGIYNIIRRCFVLLSAATIPEIHTKLSLRTRLSPIKLVGGYRFYTLYKLYIIPSMFKAKCCIEEACNVHVYVTSSSALFTLPCWKKPAVLKRRGWDVEAGMKMLYECTKWQMASTY